MPKCIGSLTGAESRKLEVEKLKKKILHRVHRGGTEDTEKKSEKLVIGDFLG
jgi:hypothetical protein